MNWILFGLKGYNLHCRQVGENPGKEIYLVIRLLFGFPLVNRACVTPYVWVTLYVIFNFTAFLITAILCKWILVGLGYDPRPTSRLFQLIFIFGPFPQFPQEISGKYILPNTFLFAMHSLYRNLTIYVYSSYMIQCVVRDNCISVIFITSTLCGI